MSEFSKRIAAAQAVAAEIKALNDLAGQHYIFAKKAAGNTVGMMGVDRFALYYRPPTNITTAIEELTREFNKLVELIGVVV